MKTLYNYLLSGLWAEGLGEKEKLRNFDILTKRSESILRNLTYSK